MIQYSAYPILGHSQRGHMLSRHSAVLRLNVYLNVAVATRHTYDY